MSQAKGNKKSARTSIRLSEATKFDLATYALISGKPQDEIVDTAIRTFVSDKIPAQEIERLRKVAADARRENEEEPVAKGRKGVRGALSSAKSTTARTDRH